MNTGPSTQTIPPVNEPSFNKFLGFLLNSPLRFLSRDNFLYLTYKGRKTGYQRSLPVQYAVHGTDFVVYVGQSSRKKWWRNFQSEWPISVVRKGRRIASIGRVVEPGSDEAVELATSYFHRHPTAAESHGLKGVTKTSELDAEQVRAAIEADVIIRITPST